MTILLYLEVESKFEGCVAVILRFATNSLFLQAVVLTLPCFTYRDDTLKNAVRQWMNGRRLQQNHLESCEIGSVFG